MASKKESEGKQHDQAEEKADKETSKSAGDEAEFDVSQEIDALLQALQGDLSKIEIETVDQWYSFLHKLKEPGVKELAGELKDLQKMLKGGKATGHDISEALIHIGEQTTDSSNGEKGLQQSVQRLGKQLRKAGTAIAKAEDQEYHQQLDSLLEKADKELTSLDRQEAVSAIDFWYNLLHKAEGAQFKQAADSLKGLKQALSRDNAKQETIAKALTKVGEDTTKIASAAPRGFKGAIQKLGKQLTNAGASLTAAE